MYSSRDNSARSECCTATMDSMVGVPATKVRSPNVAPACRVRVNVILSGFPVSASSSEKTFTPPERTMKNASDGSPL